MNGESHAAASVRGFGRSPGPLAKPTCLLLVLALAAFSTLAKNAKYYPNSHPIRHLSKSSKMDVEHAAPVLDANPPCLPREPVLWLPAARNTRYNEPEDLLLQRIGLNVSRQHRSPPSFLA